MKLTVLVIFLALCGCSSFQTLGSGESVWIEEKLGGTRYVYYCTAVMSKESDKKAPFCKQAQFLDRKGKGLDDLN